jgi:hypothetical protein
MIRTERKALRVIAEALKEPDGGSYWPARNFWRMMWWLGITIEWGW